MGSRPIADNQRSSDRRPVTRAMGCKKPFQMLSRYMGVILEYPKVENGIRAEASLGTQEPLLHAQESPDQSVAASSGIWAR